MLTLILKIFSCLHFLNSLFHAIINAWFFHLFHLHPEPSRCEAVHICCWCCCCFSSSSKKSYKFLMHNWSSKQQHSNLFSEQFFTLTYAHASCPGWQTGKPSAQLSTKTDPCLWWQAGKQQQKQVQTHVKTLFPFVFRFCWNFISFSCCCIKYCKFIGFNEC